MASYTGGIPVIGGAQWNGNATLATKNQLLSSIAGLYADIQDIELSSITIADLKVSTLTAAKWISTPELYVSSIIGGGIQVNNGLLQISTGDFSLVSLSTLSLKGIDLGGIDLSFDLGLGNALGGLLGGLGALVGGAFIGIGTGVGLTVQGLETGLATLINGRGENFINNNVFETINGSTQLQISTLGGPDAYYSSIFRTVSSVSANEVPGPQIFTSTIFAAGTTCVRSVSDPLSIITADSNIATSTIQSFGQWVPFLDPTNTGEDIYARNAYFSSLNVSLANTAEFAAAQIRNTNNSSNTFTLWCGTTHNSVTSSFNTPVSQSAIACTSNETFVDFNGFPLNLNFISTTYSPYTSSIGNYSGGVFFITSSITNSLSTIPQFTYTGSILGGANIAICEEDESNFLSTATMDFIAQSSNILIQWGLAVNNRNSTIGVGTSKRVTWDNTANTSNFIDIPVPQSTIVGGRSNAFAIRQYPNQTEFVVQNQTPFQAATPNPLAFNVSRACFGSNTAYNNQPGYPYQFNGSLFVDGIVEADTLIATSSILAISTNIQTFFSTQTFEADEATVSSLVITSLMTSPNATITNLTTTNTTTCNATISSLQTNFIGGDQISSFGIETYTNLTQFAYVSTLVVDFQIFGNLTPGVIAYLQDIRGSNGATITTDNGIFKQVSTTNLATSNIYISSGQQIGLTNLYNYPGATTAFTASGNTAPFVGIGFKAQLSTNQDNQTRIDYNWNQITGTSNGANFYPLATFDPTQTLPNFWTLSNVNSLTTSTINVNTISTTSHSGSDITCDNITINDFATFPSVANLSNVITMTFSNNTNSNQYTALQANLIQGSVFPQTSNQFSITTSGSNTTIQDRQGLVFQTVTGNSAIFGSGIDILEMTAGDFFTRSVKYGTSAGGYLQPRAFNQTYSVNMDDNTNLVEYVQVTDSNANTFLVSDYNFMPCMLGFNVQNTAIATNEVTIFPYQSNGYWWVRLSVWVNALPGQNDMNWYWNNLLFPYNMMT